MEEPRGQFEQAYSSIILGPVLAVFLAGCGTVVNLRPVDSDTEFKHPVLEPRIAGRWTVVPTYLEGGF